MSKRKKKRKRNIWLVKMILGNVGTTGELSVVLIIGWSKITKKGFNKKEEAKWKQRWRERERKERE